MSAVKPRIAEALAAFHAASAFTLDIPALLIDLRSEIERLETRERDLVRQLDKAIARANRLAEIAGLTHHPRGPTSV